MPFSPAYYTTYLGVPEKLEKKYPDLPFDNHCYLRIALDNALGTVWTTKIAKPAYRSLSPRQLDRVLQYLNSYLDSKSLLMAHNKQSLKYRKQWKTHQLKFAL